MSELLPALTLFGGLALFLFAMGLLADGLRQAATGWLRRTLRAATRSPVRGLLLGSGLGLFMHSSATTVMLVGFIEAGLLTLAAAIPGILGANIGTTLAMQIVSFHIGDFWAVPLIFGTATWLAAHRPTVRKMGQIGIGFGLLLLGLVTMSGAVAPYRSALLPWLAHLDGTTAGGLWKGILAGTLVTLIVQSSGATIGMCFALIAGGAVTRLEQVFPVILGAHIGTCSTALIAALGASPEARRAALAHLFFNLYGVALAAGLAPWLVPLLRATSGDLLRQAANAHTGVMLLAMLPLLPFSSGLAAGLRRLVHFRTAEAEPSHLDETLLPTPEQALAACIRELQRVARLGAKSLRRNASLLLKPDVRLDRCILRDEDVLDEIQIALREYLTALTARRLSRRQALMVQHLERCMTDIERIGDHNNNLRELSQSRHQRRTVLPREALEQLVQLFESADGVVRRVIESLNPDLPDFTASAQAILDARDRYAQLSTETKTAFLDQTAAHTYTPLQGMVLSDYALELDRIVRHSRLIGLVERHPFFWIKREKLGRVMPEADYPPTPPEGKATLAGRLPLEDFP